MTLNKRHMHLGVALDLPSSPQQTITRPTYPRNLKLKADANRDQAIPGEAPEAIEPDASSTSRPSAQVPQWGLDDSKPGMVRVAHKFKDLRAGKDSNMELWHLQSRLGIPTQFLSEVLRTDSDSDCLVVHRHNDKQGHGKCVLDQTRTLNPWRSCKPRCPPT